MPVPIEPPEGFSARSAQHADLPAMHAVQAAYEQHVLGEVLVELEDLQSDWQLPGFDPERDSVLVFQGDVVAASGQVWQGRRVAACVSPEFRGRGIGAALLDWSSRVGAQCGSRMIGQTVPDDDPAAAQLFRGRGWTPLYTSWVLELPPGQAIAARELPAGYAMRTFRAGKDERVAYQVVEDAFGEWAGREPNSFDEWAAGVLRRPGFEPWQLLLAVVGDGAAARVIGACHVVVSGGAGWVNQVAVARAHRHRGVAQALLAAASRAARDRGADRFELSTDSRTGALALYERLGMRVKWAFTHWSTHPA